MQGGGDGPQHRTFSMEGGRVWWKGLGRSLEKTPQLSQKCRGWHSVWPASLPPVARSARGTTPAKATLKDRLGDTAGCHYIPQFPNKTNRPLPSPKRRNKSSKLGPLVTFGPFPVCLTHFLLSPRQMARAPGAAIKAPSRSKPKGLQAGRGR